MIPYIIILGIGVFVALFVAWIVFRHPSMPKPNFSSNTTGNSTSDSTVVAFTDPISSHMKFFYSALFFYVSFLVFGRIGSHAFKSWGHFSQIPDTPGNKFAYSIIIVLLIFFEVYHFLRMYLYLHQLEDPSSIVYKRYIRPFHNERCLLLCEHFVRFVLVGIVTLKMFENYLLNIDAFRMFVAYLLLFYIFLLLWDYIVAKSSQVKNDDTFYVMNIIGIITLFFLLFALPHPEEITENGEKVTKMVGGNILIVLTAVVVHIGGLLLSFINEWRGYKKRGEKSIWREYREELSLLFPKSVNISEECNTDCLHHRILQQQQPFSSNQKPVDSN